MQLRRRLGSPALLLRLLFVIACLAAGVAAPAHAAPAKDAAAAKAKKAKGPPAPKPGWAVGRVRFEPLAPSAPIEVTGVGAYRGAIEVAPAPAPAAPNRVAVVNDVGLEDYVKGIAEVPSTWPAEALKAQAIAARTYALYEAGLDGATAARQVGAQLCATEACQVYAGVAKEQDPDGGADWAAAVEQTTGQVVLFKGAPINAKYSSSNGGRSAAGGQPYLRAADDPDDRFSPLHRWQSTLALTDVAAALGLPGTIVGVGRQQEYVDVDWQGADNAIGRLQIAAPDFRARLNGLPPPPGLPRAVPSTRFTPTADPAGNRLTLDGAGWGHFLGMSQWGAYGKALRGMKAPDILAAYYAGLRPTPAPLPPNIKVAVDLGRPDAEVAARAGRFRILDEQGRAIAVAATGAWRVVPEGPNRLRVLPPPGQDQFPAVHPLAVDPAAPRTRGAGNVRFRLTAPAVVQVSVTDETGAPAGVTTATLLEPGDITQALPALSRPGRYTVTISADAGGGRTATATAPEPVEVQPLGTPTIQAVAVAGVTAGT
ncbi:MAG TPA: SpoIID/LytB domain-containing protein, partial [Acidimicrobiales bacterium]|nr:SpoIID/LytB domain-containing protein [Acidimicrobiales bacterium]